MGGGVKITLPLITINELSQSLTSRGAASNVKGTHLQRMRAQRVGVRKLDLYRVGGAYAKGRT